MQRRLSIEGWRLIQHSYALVTQAYCLALLKRGDIDLRFTDIAYRNPAWKRTAGLLSAADEATISTIPAVEASFVADVTLHMWPNFDAPKSGRKVAFGTPELRWVYEEWRHGRRTGAEVAETVSVLTTTRWTALAFERFGIPVERIHVVPLGFDPAHFHPDDASRAAMRARLGVTEDNPVFLSVGAMTWNKGIDLLLKAFARVAETVPSARLVLKGADAIYPSRALVMEQFNALTPSDQALVSPRLSYSGDALTSVGMADLFRAADCYVSPYLAEGFNMPVLEAAACGVPIVCTDGGCTDDFTDPSFALRIRSQPIVIPVDDHQQGHARMPDLADLIAVMVDVATNRAKSRAMGQLGARYVARRYTWAAVTELLVQELLTRGH
jgi:glycosyltransferase involved in cell wall biosynthesis